MAVIDAGWLDDDMVQRLEWRTALNNRFFKDAAHP